MYNHKKLKTKKGFTLAELLITIFVFTVGILGVYLFVQRLIATANYASLRFTAAYLAQEGIEIVRNIRDTNWLEGNAWDEGLAEGNNYGVQYNIEGLLADYGDIPLQLDANGFYSYNGIQETPFKRKVNITKINDYTLKIVVEVSWSDQFSPIVVQENLYKWH
jgi:prepilin-type N-terminal cleavage/methylation domain-containing protein